MQASPVEIFNRASRIADGSLTSLGSTVSIKFNRRPIIPGRRSRHDADLATFIAVILIRNETSAGRLQQHIEVKALTCCFDRLK